MSETRVCNRCGYQKIISEFSEYKSKNRGYRRLYCRSCEGIARREYRAEGKYRERHNLRERKRSKAKREDLVFVMKERSRTAAYMRNKWATDQSHREKSKERYKEWFKKAWLFNAAFREAAKERARRWKEKIHPSYANELLGGSSSNKYPPELVAIKQVHLRIKRLLKENQ